MTGPMSVECATLLDMGEPQSVGAVLESMRERLARMGMDPALVDQPLDLPSAETADERAERLALQAQNKASRWRASLPAIYRDATLASLREDQNAQEMRSWLVAGYVNAVLVGAVGSGKTYAAYAVGNAAIDRGVSTEAWGVHELLAALRPGGQEREVDHRVRSAELLILDDLMMGASPFAVDTITAILNERVNHGRRTIVTTNLTADEMTTTWGPRIMDRIMYRAQVMKFSGKSLRRTW